MPVRRHRAKDETVPILRGVARVFTYNDRGQVKGNTLLDRKAGNSYGVNFSMEPWYGGGGFCVLAATKASNFLLLCYAPR